MVKNCYQFNLQTFLRYRLGLRSVQVALKPGSPSSTFIYEVTIKLFRTANLQPLYRRSFTKIEVISKLLSHDNIQRYSDYVTNKNSWSNKALRYAGIEPAIRRAHFIWRGELYRFDIRADYYLLLSH